ncbi:nucleotidyltransferase substrate binding protein [Thiosulfativibrio zosterae]|uniref:Nucleotidyltransferase n=1 Tax=Thiosulfativibrio zosterae TaxID=2675053 RepID=A0A6F8PQD9_9GAMM|nr:nucleotidyltransferase substrate binding protein [Thiosulfativibrio zosterae]BBP44210.1 nucleotidyltransferase [Thiosulfativibrio zosterae]
MQQEQDIRWIQRFNNYQNALKQLDKAMVIVSARPLSELEQQGVIQAFEYNYELAWNVLKDFYEYQGEISIQGSRDAFRMAFSRGLIDNDKLWLEMVKTRQLTVHTYNEATMLQVLKAIQKNYYPAFVKLKNDLMRLLPK